LNERKFQLEWDKVKAAANVYKHGVSFELAATVFRDPRLLSVADLMHSETEERWASIGTASNGSILCIVYLWSESEPVVIKIRIISARKATLAEAKHYNEGL
jgi:uncharacterized DUF497 family protein